MIHRVTMPRNRARHGPRCLPSPHPVSHKRQRDAPGGKVTCRQFASIVAEPCTANAPISANVGSLSRENRTWRHCPACQSRAGACRRRQCRAGQRRGRSGAGACRRYLQLDGCRRGSAAAGGLCRGDPPPGFHPRHQDGRQGPHRAHLFRMGGSGAHEDRRAMADHRQPRECGRLRRPARQARLRSRSRHLDLQRADLRDDAVPGTCL